MDRDTAAVRWLVWSIGGIAALVVAAFLIAWLAKESKRREEFTAIRKITNSSDPELDPDQRHYVELWVLTKRPAEELAALADLKFYSWDSLWVSSHAPLGAREARALSDLPHVHSLSIPDISSQAMQIVGRQPELREIYFDPPCDASRITAAEPMSSLIAVGLSESSSVSAAIPWLNSCQNLTWIDLERSDVTDDDLRELSKHATLEMLHLNSTSISAAGLESLRSCPSLRYVFAYETPAASDDIVQLPDWPFELELH